MTAAEDRIRDALPGYDIGGELGRGSWGVVLEGHHRQLKRDVALKQLPEALAADRAVRARFEEEARTLAKLDHPHIVPVYDFLSEDGLCVLVMEKLPGGTVWCRFTSEGLTAEDACAVALATSAALHCAHERGVLHRDIKPDNLMFSSSGTVKVTDFGIAKVIGGAETVATRGGETLGTPAYMAPEQALGGEPTPATDVYATGVMLYELLSGVLPFSHEGGSVAVMYRHVHEPPAPLGPAAPSVPTTIADVVMRALATDPADRYLSAADFGVALATATTSAWGPGWLKRSSISVMAAGSIEAVTGSAVPPTGPPAPTVRLPPATVVGSTAATRRQPRLIEPPPGRLDLVPVQDLVRPRRRPPLGYVAAAFALLALMVVVALAGPGSSKPTRDVTTGGLAVNGVPLPTDAALDVDLAKPVVISGPLPPAHLRNVRLSFSVLDVPLGSADTATIQPADGGFTSSLDVSDSRYLLAGQVLATVDLVGGDGVVAAQSFFARSTQPWILTAPGVGVIAFVLFVLGYAESLLRTLRRGRSRSLTRVVGLVVVGGLIGIATVTLAWLTGVNSPAVGTLVACAALGAACGVALALGARALGPRPAIKGPSPASV